jgi:hypothetical protein
MGVKRESKDRLRRRECDRLDTADSSGFEDVVRLSDVGVEDDVVGLEGQHIAVG